MNTTQPKHTATPWTYGRDAETGKLYIDCGGGLPVIAVVDQYHESHEANVRFIVTACNAHEELVRALKEIYDEANNTMKKGVFGWPAGLSIACANAREVLAKAKATTEAA